MLDLVPELNQIKVSPDKLVLDPNNPRLITKDEDRKDESEALDLMVQTMDKMRIDELKTKEIENSIRQNGWWPIDFIFVKKYDETRYLVLEGNRRVTAIKQLIEDTNTGKKLKDDLSEISVMEIIDDIPPDQLQDKIVYLLGVRHHGSLKKWSPFARAKNIYTHYLELTEQSRDSFEWRDNYGQKIADALSIPNKEVKNRLKVYRAMEQIGNTPEVKQSEKEGAGIKDRYYSVCEEVLQTSNKALRKYIHQKENDFLLNEQSLMRIVKLCRFDQPRREDSPINNPQEWRKLQNILEDEDLIKRKENLRMVEEDAIKPSIVWAKRSEELQKLQWDKWLRKVILVLKKVGLGADFDSEDALDATSRLLALIKKLDAKDLS